jgi:hypothetical protein
MQDSFVVVGLSNRKIIHQWKKFSLNFSPTILRFYRLDLNIWSRYDRLGNGLTTLSRMRSTPSKDHTLSCWRERTLQCIEHGLSLLGEHAFWVSNRADSIISSTCSQRPDFGSFEQYSGSPFMSFIGFICVQLQMVWPVARIDSATWNRSLVRIIKKSNSQEINIWRLIPLIWTLSVLSFFRIAEDLLVNAILFSP